MRFLRGRFPSFLWIKEKVCITMNDWTNPKYRLVTAGSVFVARATANPGQAARCTILKSLIIDAANVLSSLFCSPFICQNQWR